VVASYTTRADLTLGWHPRPECSLDIQPTFTENSRGSNEPALTWFLSFLPEQIPPSDPPSPHPGQGPPGVALPARVEACRGITHQYLRVQRGCGVKMVVKMRVALHGTFVFVWFHAQWQSVSSTFRPTPLA